MHTLAEREAVQLREVDQKWVPYEQARAKVAPLSGQTPPQPSPPARPDSRSRPVESEFTVKDGYGPRAGSAGLRDEHEPPCTGLCVRWPVCAKDAGTALHELSQGPVLAANGLRQ